jgi:Spy/CpxP family protein refolding chaperone
MIVPKVGLMMLITGVVALAQQPPQPATPPQPAVQVAPKIPVNDAERRRFEEITARMARGEMISPDDQRFVREMMSRINRAQRPVAAAQLVAPARSLQRALGGPGGRWWTRPQVAQKLQLTADQTKKMDDVFQQYRLKLIDLNAAVQKEEAIMEPLVSAEPPDEAKIVAQIDKVAQARAELEKANARMLLGIRRLLTQEQWNKLKSEVPPVTPQPIMPAPSGR